MKKKLVGLIALTASLSMCAMLGACGGDDGDSSGGEHAWGTTWSKDSTGHWHGCGDDGCDEKDSFAAHTPSADDGDCTTPITCSVCGYETTAGVAAHDAGPADWAKDADEHWKLCVNPGCTQKMLVAAHDINNSDCTTGGTCSTCGYTVAPKSAHEHTAPTSITGDADITCDNCSVVVAKTLAGTKTYSKSADDAASNVLPAAITGTPTHVYVDYVDIWNGTGVDFSEIEIQEGAIVKVETETMTYYYKANLCDNLINSADEFFTAINANFDGYYVLGQDLDFSAQIINDPTTGTSNTEDGWNSIGWNTTQGGDIAKFTKFTGTLDGNGYALKNITIKGHNGTQGISAAFIGYAEDATVKNLMADITVAPSGINANSVKNVGLIGRADKCVIDNCAVVLHTTYACYQTYVTVAPIVGLAEKGTTITNCVGVLDTSAGIVSTNKTTFATLAGTNDTGNWAVVNNCYGIYVPASGDTWTPTLVATKDTFEVQGSEAYNNFSAFFGAVTSLSANDGWNDSWKIEDNKLYFGDEWVHVHAFDQQNASEAYTATPASCTGNRTCYYSCACGAKGTTTFDVANTQTAHDVPANPQQSDWQSDGTGHWLTCSNCTEKVEFAAHSDPDDNCATEDYCTICNYRVHTAGAHTYDVPTGALTNGDVNCTVCGTKVAQTIAAVSNYSKDANDSASSLPSAIQGTVSAIEINGTNVGTSLDLTNVTAGEAAQLVTVVTDTTTYYYYATVCTNVLTSAEEFFTAINADFGGYYVLGQDINFSANKVNYSNDGVWNTIGWKGTEAGDISKYVQFTGVLDGKGYALKNVTLRGHNGTNLTQGINACLFGYTNGATIKNLMADLTIDGEVAGTIKNAGLIGNAVGGTVVENCVVVLKTKSGGYGSNKTVGAIAGTLGANSKISNCVAILNTSAGITSTTNFGTVAGTAGGDAAGIENSYGIYVGAEGDTWTPVLKADGGLTIAQTSAVYNGCDEFTTGVSALSDANGWNSYWSLADGTLKFGDETIISAE